MVGASHVMGAIMPRSENWRINKSGIMAVEGAQALRALQKVAGAVGLPSHFQVRFATQGRNSGIDFDKNEVVIGAGRLFTEAPIPADLFDVLVGLTLHEVGHLTIQTDRVWSGTPIYSMTMADTEKAIFQKFINIGEDVVIESSIRANENLAEYDEALHSWAITQMRDAQPHRLLEVWIEYALGHKSSGVLGLPDELVEPMQQLVALTGWLRKMPGYALRAEAYIKYWATVKDIILNPPKPPDMPEPPSSDENKESGTDGEPQPESQLEPQSEPSTPEPDSPEEEDSKDEEPTHPEASEDGTPDSDGEDNSGEEEDDTAEPSADLDDAGGGDEDEDNEFDMPLTPQSGDAISDELAEEIEVAIESESEDITDEVTDALEEHTGKAERIATVIRSRETKTPLIKPDRILSKKLERVMTIRKRLQTRTMRGEQYGRIDKRHLHRIATDERVFSLRYKFPDGFPNTRILLDLSGSMSRGQANEVLEAAGALQTLVNAEVWCYYNDDKVQLIRVDDGKLIHQFKPAGSTPSGLAIVGVAVGLRKGGLVIHLTDGKHNHGQSPWTAHWVLKKKGVDLVNLIWGGDAKHYALDGMNMHRLHGLAEFPDALYRILIEQTKLSKIGGK